MAKVNGNLLEGTNAQVTNWIFTCLFWIISPIMQAISNNIIDNIKRLNFYGLIQDVFFDITLGFYIIYLLLQFFTTGFRKFMRFHSFKTVIKNNIENKFKIKFHGESYHYRTDMDSNGNERAYKVTTFNETIKFYSNQELIIQ